MEKRVDGLIIQVSNLNKTLCKKMDALNFPYIVIGQPHFESNMCWIDINNKSADDVAVISFDNYPLSMYTEPQLTVVDNDVFELGTHAANALLNKINNPNLQMQYSMLSPTLIIRESTRKK